MIDHTYGPREELNRESLADLARHLPHRTVGGVQTILRSVRSHLGMDVAFVSQFVGHQRYFRNVDVKAGPAPLRSGDAMSLSEGYCQKVVEGQLPELIPDTASVPAAQAIKATSAMPIGSHLSVPIRLRDGHLYGTFCCFSYAPDRTLNERDLHFMRAFAEVAAFQIEHDLATGARRSEQIERIDNALAHGQPSIVYQPKVSAHSRHVHAFEALSRFYLDPLRGPAEWFAEAAEVGRGGLLELQAIRNAIRGLAASGGRGDIALCVNTSAQTLIDHDLAACLDGFAPERLIVELTEHDYVPDYARLQRALAPLRALGVRIAIDDAGAGYASMAHILNINPDFIKLDMSLTRNIDNDRKRRALAAALIEFGRQTDCEIVAEGVETAAEFDALRGLGVQWIQGFYISPPVPIDRVPALTRSLEG